MRSGSPRGGRRVTGPASEMVILAPYVTTPLIMTPDRCSLAPRPGVPAIDLMTRAAAEFLRMLPQYGSGRRGRAAGSCRLGIGPRVRPALYLAGPCPLCTGGGTGPVDRRRDMNETCDR